MNIDDWKSQIKRGTLVLAAKENTIYPLLRRLMKEGYVSSSWQESAEGLPPRKYYSITDKEPIPFSKLRLYNRASDKSKFKEASQ